MNSEEVRELKKLLELKKLEIVELKRKNEEKDLKIAQLEKRNQILNVENQKLKDMCKREERARIKAEEELNFYKIKDDDTPSTILYSESVMEDGSSGSLSTADSIPSTIPYDEMELADNSEALASELAQKHKENEKLKQELLQTKAEFRERIVNQPVQLQRPVIEKEYKKADQVNELVKVLARTRQPSAEDYKTLVSKTGLEKSSIRRWFSSINSRAKDLMDRAAEESSKLREVMDLMNLKHDDIERVFYMSH